GIQRARGGALPQGESVRILLPAGAGGPAFAIYPNFRVIRRYNNATSYALAVAHLAERLEGGPPFAATWPRGDRALSRGETEELQRLLTAGGFDTKGVDGIAGPNTRGAVRAWQAANGRVPDGYISGRLLERVRASRG
ncbi:MAG: peptidoglycan-binding protein, partial [Pseudomonadota bacterium]